MKFLEKIIGRIILRVHVYMEETGREDSFERFPYLAVLAERYAKMEETSRVQNAEMTCVRDAEMPYVQNGETPCAQNAEIQEERYEALLQKLSSGREDAVLTAAVDLALATTLVTEFAAYLNYYTGNRATLQLAYELCGIFCPDYAKLKEERKRLGRAFCIEKKTPLCYANIEAGHELLSYLSGENCADPGAVSGVRTERFSCKDPLHPMYVREPLAAAGAELLAGGKTILQICGRGGRRFLVKHIAKRMERDVLFVRADQICGAEEEKEYWLLQTVREAFLFSGIVCVKEDNRKAERRKTAEMAEAKEGIFHAARVLSEAGIPVILCTESAEKPYGISMAGTGTEDPGGGKLVWMELAPLTRAERMLVWQGIAEQYHLEINIEQCSVQYRLNASGIARAAAEWRKGDIAAECGGGWAKEERAERISDICYRMLCTGETQKLGTVIRPRAALADLIVSEQMKKTLGEICCGAAQGYRIYEEWGLGRHYPYGRGVSVLLAGAPGTGKTMTAHVLAKEIGVPLYQVDLPHIMDKYIGETEKHLEQVFDFAAKTNMVLFFDEADALFAKRGEITEGKDRYANMEVSYLLQRMEQFDGIVVLATNFYHHIDKAFLRRIKYVLKYQEPDEAMRRRMWESCLTPALPQEKIDTDYLAKRFALSGGVIKNVIQNACIAAVYEKRPLCMEHLLGAIRMEYEKLDRSITPEFWGEYGYLMK